MRRLLIINCVLITSILISCSFFDQPPPPPDNVRVEVDDEWWEYILKWDAVPGATVYITRRWADGDENRMPNNTTAQRRRFDNLDRDKTHYFSVQAQRDGKLSSSVVVSVEGDSSFPNPFWEELESTGPSGPPVEEIDLSIDSSILYNQAKHADKKAAWKTLNISNYRFTATNGGTDPDLMYYTITVSQNNKPYMIANMESYNQKNPFGYVYGKTINEFFESFPLKIEENSGRTWYVRYNEKYHYPEFIAGYGLKYTTYFFYISSFEVLDIDE